MSKFHKTWKSDFGDQMQDKLTKYLEPFVEMAF